MIKFEVIAKAIAGTKEQTQMITNYECTFYFRGKDGLGTCDTDCQWWQDGCPAAKGSDRWDGREYYAYRNSRVYSKHAQKEKMK